MFIRNLKIFYRVKPLVLILQYLKRVFLKVTVDFMISSPFGLETLTKLPKSENYVIVGNF
jgi:hypothetical protein